GARDGAIGRALRGGLALHRRRPGSRRDPRKCEMRGAVMNAPIKKPKAQFAWDDPLLLDQQLTQEERMVRDAAHDYAQGKLAPRVLEAFRNETTDPAIFREMGQLGMLGPTIAPEYGGPGLSYVA